jgi:hypothetical protein
MSFYRGRRGRSRFRKERPTPNSWSEFYMFMCQHCKEMVFVRASELWGVFGKTFECNLCHGVTRVYKRTHSFDDKCKSCDKLVKCMSTPVMQVGTGTNIKKRSYLDEATKNRIMINRHDIC